MQPAETARDQFIIYTVALLAVSYIENLFPDQLATHHGCEGNTGAQPVWR